WIRVPDIADIELRNREKGIGIVVVVAITEESVELLARHHIDADNVIAAGVCARGRLLPVIHAELRRARGEECIRQREEVQHRLPPAIDAAGRNDVARERQPSLRIFHNDLATVLASCRLGPCRRIVFLSNIPTTDGRGRECPVLGTYRQELTGIFLRTEREDSRLVLVEMARNVKGAAKAPTLNVVPVALTLNAGLVVRERVRVEVFVAVRPP